MGLNFYDYHDFQPKIRCAYTYATQCKLIKCVERSIIQYFATFIEGNYVMIGLHLESHQVIRVMFVETELQMMSWIAFMHCQAICFEFLIGF